MRHDLPRLALALIAGAALVGNAPARRHGAVPSHRAAHGVRVRGPVRAPAAALSPADAFLERNARVRGIVRTASGLQYRVLEAGAGAHPGDDDVALVGYVGTLTDGTVFDRSAQPTPLAVAGVVPGFAEALKLMAKGARYRVWIKPSLGYGDRAVGPIPAGSVLAFDIDLLDVMPAATYRQSQSSAAAPPAP